MKTLIQSQIPRAIGRFVLRLLPFAVLLAAGCGPVYVQERDDGYYGRGYNQNSQGYQQPVQPAQAEYAQGQPAQQADPYFSDLSAYGSWTATADYGRVWVPYANRTPGWRPYFYGSWSYTSYGWTWVSDEAWGAGPYHYGRWEWLNGYQWVWVPGYTWGPAWVVWGSGGGCVGWAPMGYHYDAYSNVRVHQTYWVFVPQNQMGSHVQHVVIQANDVPRVYNQTVVVQSTAQIRGQGGQTQVYNRGPAPAQVEQWTQRPVTPRPAEQIPSTQPRAIPQNAQEPARVPPRQPSQPAQRDPQVPQTRVPDGGGRVPVQEHGDGRQTPMPDQGRGQPTQPQQPVPGRDSGRADPAQPPQDGRGAPTPPTTPGRADPVQPQHDGRGPSPVQPPPGRDQGGRPPEAQPPHDGRATQEPPGRQPEAPSRPGAGYTPPAQPQQPPARQPEAPSRPGAGYTPPAQPQQPPAQPPARQPDPPSRPGAGYAPPAAPPSRPGAGYSPPPAQPGPNAPQYRDHVDTTPQAPPGYGNRQPDRAPQPPQQPQPQPNRPTPPPPQPPPQQPPPQQQPPPRRAQPAPAAPAPQPAAPAPAPRGRGR